jgi:hypothetical protein
VTTANNDPAVAVVDTKSGFAPETLPAAVMWAVALLVAHSRGQARRAADCQPWVYLFASWLVSLALCTPAARRCLDRFVSESRQSRFIALSFASEGVGMLLFVVGACTGRPSLAVMGLFVTTQGGLISKVQRKTTGAKADTVLQLMVLTTTAQAHHLASFITLANKPTAAFVLFWRFVSISGHALGYLKDNYTVPQWVLATIGWGRFYICVGLVQPAIIAVMLGCCGRHPLVHAIFTGLLDNCLGHSTYMLFRVMRLQEQKVQRDTLGAAFFRQQPNSFGRAYPMLEIEQGLLCAATGLLLLRAATTSPPQS